MSVAIAGVVVAGIGVAANIYSSSKATSAAKKAGKRADAADDRRMDFEEKRYDEWQDTYGPLEDRLADYYETLTPTLRITQGLEAFEKEKGIALSNFREAMAERNVDRSGVAMQVEKDTAIQSAEVRAKIRADAPMEVAREQSRFLQIGLGQNPDQGIREGLTTEQTRSSGLESQTARNAGQARGAMIDSLGDFAQMGLTTWRESIAANPTTRSTSSTGGV